MSNAHVNHQHGLTTMNATRPKSKLHKRRNKAKGKEKKAVLLAELKKAIAEAKQKNAGLTKPAKSTKKTAAVAEKVGA
jgi:hypothetical protein